MVCIYTPIKCKTKSCTKRDVVFWGLPGRYQLQHPAQICRETKNARRCFSPIPCVRLVATMIVCMYADAM